MFFLGHLVLGVFLGMAASRAIRWRRFHHGFHGGCGRMAGGPWGFGGWHRHHHQGFGGFGGPMWMGGRGGFGFIRDLGISSEQMRELKDAFLKGRGAVAGLRASGFEGFHSLVEAALAEPVDRARLDETARRFADDQGQGARDLVEALDKALTVLTPEQKAKIRERFGRYGSGMGPGMPPGAGPYRTSPGAYV